MKRLTWILVLASFLHLGRPLLGGRSPAVVSLDRALIDLAKVNHWVVVASIQAPLPQVSLTSSSSISEVVKELRGELPAYHVSSPSSKILVIEPKASGGPLQHRLKEYFMPPTLGGIKAGLPNALLAADQGVSGVGGIMNGLVSSVDLAVPLKRERMRNVSGIDILTRAGSELNGLASILMLQDRSASTLTSSSFRDWQLLAGPRLAAYPNEPPKEVERAPSAAFPPVKKLNQR